MKCREQRTCGDGPCGEDLDEGGNCPDLSCPSRKRSVSTCCPKCDAPKYQLVEDGYWVCVECGFAAMYVTEGGPKDWSDSDGPAPAQPELPTLYELVPRFVSDLVRAGEARNAGLAVHDEVRAEHERTPMTTAQYDARLHEKASNLVVEIATALAKEVQRRLREEANE